MIGRVLDHYRVVEALGAGGMGEVYRAHDEQLDRDVALKVLSSGNAGEEAVRGRLLHEARLASALNHPSICTIYQVGGSGPQPFIAMEFVAGRTLAQLTLGRSLPIEQTLTFAIQIADALDHAHSRGVIHRDLKCANVIVTSGERVKVLDFGLAKRIEGPELGAVTMSAASLTGEGAIAGTLPYMAPEVLRGEVASTASDIWAFGVLLYEMVAGKLPFDGQSAYDLTTSIMRDAPNPISHRLPPALGNVLQRCLSKEAGQRYRTAGELRAALQAVAAGGHGSAAPARAVRAALLAGVCVAAVLGFWGIVRVLPGRSAQLDSIAILPFANAGTGAETEYLSDGLTDNLIDAASRLPSLRVSSHKSVFHYKGKDVDPRSVGRELGVKSVLVGGVTVQNGNLAVDAELIDTASLSRLWKGHYARRLSESVALEEDIARDLTGRLTGQAAVPPKSTEMRSNEAYQAHLKGEYHLNKHTPEEMEQARQYFEEAIAADPTYAPAYIGLAGYYDTLADSGLAEPATTLLKSKAAADKALQLDPKAIGPANNLAYFRLAYDWDFAGAEQEFRRLIAARPDDPTNYVQYAICMRILGRSDDAIAASRRAVALDPLVVDTSGDLGWTYYYAHRFDGAIVQFRDTLILDPGYAPAHFGLALSFHQKGMEEQAATEFVKYLESSGTKEGADAFEETYRRSGYRSALNGLWRLQLKVLQEDAKQEYVSPMLFASTYALLGRKNETFDWLEKAYEERSMKLLDLRVDPDFDTVRGDPRFSQLIKRIRLP